MKKNKIVASIAAAAMMLPSIADVAPLVVTASAAEEGLYIWDPEIFPDENFASYLYNYDADWNSYLSAEEIANATIMDIGTTTLDDAKKISSLKGIEYFTELTTLDCSGHKITNLDVSKNTKLTTLNCYNNELTSLNVKNNTMLEDLWCDGNQLKVLDVSGLTKLSSFSYYDNPLTKLDASGCTSLTDVIAFDGTASETIRTIDLSGCISLEYIECYDQPALETVDLSNCKNLLSVTIYANPKLTTVDLTGCSSVEDVGIFDCALSSFSLDSDAVTQIDVSYNNLSSVDVSGCAALNSLWIDSNPFKSLSGIKSASLEDLSCSECQLTDIDISGLPALTSLNCSLNSLGSLKLSSSVLNSLNCNYCDLTSIDISGMPSLKTLYVGDNPLTDLDFLNVNKNISHLELSGLGLSDISFLKQHTAIKTLVVSSNNFKTIDLSILPALTTLNCANNPLTGLGFLDANKNLTTLTISTLPATGISLPEHTKLTTLNIRNCNLKDLVIEDFPALKKFSHYGVNSVEDGTITIQNNPKLERVDIRSKGLASADISSNPVLSEVMVRYNETMTELNISDNESLEEINCLSGVLTDLNISGCPNMEYLNCNKNQLTELVVADMPALRYLFCSYNKLTELDVSELTELTDLVCSENELVKLDLTNNSELDRVIFNGNHITSIDLSNSPYVGGIGYADNIYKLTSASLDELVKNGFDPERASSWIGAEYDEETNSLVNITSDTVKYRYYTNGKLIKSVYFTLDTSALLTAPVVTATAGNAVVDLSWIAINGATAYRVRRNDGNGWTTLGSVSTTSYKDTAVTNGTKYTYAVFAYVDGAWSAASELVTATPAAPYECVPPTNVKATAGDSVIDITWDEVRGATAYRVRRHDGTKWATLANVTATSYKDSAVTNGTKYTYGILAQVNGTWSAASTLVAATPAAPYECVPPTGVKATAGDKTVTVTWNAVEGATAYRVRRHDGTKWATLANVTATSYKDTAVTNGTKYTYGILAQVNGTWSAASTLVAATPAAAYECVPPTGVKATGDDGVITVTWNAVEGATAYRVRRNDGTAWATLGNVTTTSYKDTAVTNGTKYTYGIFAQVNGKWSVASALVTATPDVVECIPPASVTIKSESGKVSLNWSAVNGATKYRVRRSDGNGWTNLASVSGTSYTDTAVTNGTNYVYGIFAYVEGAWSAASALVQAKPAAVVSGVANGLTITTTADSITLSWNTVSGAEKYRVRRSDGVAWATKQTSAKTTFVDTDVVAGTTYKYSIYCYSNGAFGAPSSTVAAIL